MKPVEELAEWLEKNTMTTFGLSVAEGLCLFPSKNRDAIMSKLGWTRLKEDERVVKVGDLAIATKTLSWIATIGNRAEAKHELNEVLDRLKKAMEGEGK